MPTELPQKGSHRTIPLELLALSLLRNQRRLKAWIWRTKMRLQLYRRYPFYDLQQMCRRRSGLDISFLRLCRVNDDAMHRQILFCMQQNDTRCGSSFGGPDLSPRLAISQGACRHMPELVRNGDRERTPLGGRAAFS